MPTTAPSSRCRVDLLEGQLKAALAEQSKWGGKLGEILVRMSLVSEDILVRALSKQLNIPAVNLDAVQVIPPHVRAKIPAQTARDFASAESGGIARVATSTNTFASSPGSRNVTPSRPVVITSPTRVASGSRRSATTRRRTTSASPSRRRSSGW